MTDRLSIFARLGRAMQPGVSGDGRSDSLLIKCDTNGAVLWSARYDEGRSVRLPFLAVDPADNGHLAGSV